MAGRRKPRYPSSGYGFRGHPSCTFADRVAQRTARLGTIGLGHSGLPLALPFAEAGFDVVGIDVNEDRVRHVREGESYLVYVAAPEGRLTATTDYAAVSDLDTLTICVAHALVNVKDPLARPDLRRGGGGGDGGRASAPRPARDPAVNDVPGPRVLSILERASGGAVGQDFSVGYAPERVDPGNAVWDLTNTLKLVGGITEECRERTRMVYKMIVDDVVPVVSTEVCPRGPSSTRTPSGW